MAKASRTINRLKARSGRRRAKSAAKKVSLTVKVKDSGRRPNRQTGREPAGVKQPIDKEIGQAVRDIINQPQQQLQSDKKTYLLKAERGKKLVMWSGVIFFMVLIMGGWIYNTRNMLKSTVQEESGEANWFEFNQDFPGAWDQIGHSWSQLIQAEPDQADQQSVLPDSSSSGAVAEEVIDQAEFDQLKIKLQELENKLNSEAVRQE